MLRGNRAQEAIKKRPGLHVTTAPDPVFLSPLLQETSVVGNALSPGVVFKKCGSDRACVLAGEVLVIIYSITPARGT